MFSQDEKNSEHLIKLNLSSAIHLFWVDSKMGRLTGEPYQITGTF